MTQALQALLPTPPPLLLLSPTRYHLQAAAPPVQGIVRSTRAAHQLLCGCS